MESRHVCLQHVKVLYTRGEKEKEKKSNSIPPLWHIYLFIFVKTDDEPKYNARASLSSLQWQIKT